MIVPVRGSVLAETAGSEAWWRWNGRNVGSVYVTCVLVLTGGGVSVMWCRRQWHGVGPVFGPSRGRRRLYLERACVPSVRVSVIRGRRAILHGGSRRGWTRTMGTRGCRGVSRDCGDACSVRESRTITLLVRRRTSAMVLGVTVIRRESSAITLRAAVRAASTPPRMRSFHILSHPRRALQTRG